MKIRGVVLCGMSNSIRLSEPLGQLPKQDRRRFTLSLSPKERERLRRAEAWHRKVYAQPRRKAG
jgi:hypothetical protein